MTNAIALYTGGIQNLIELAVRTDGKVFRRFQNRDPRFGYKWTAWKSTGEVLGDNAKSNLPTTRSAGFSTLFLQRGEVRRRLPA